MCSQAWWRSCRPHPPTGDEVGRDDFTLGENHVSAVQEGEGRVAPPRPPWLIPFCLSPGPGKIYPSCVPSSPAFSPYHPKWLLPDDKLCLGSANESTGGWPNGAPGSHPQVKMQCRKGIPSALRARCWPLLCGAHVCQRNSPGTYQVKELAGICLPCPEPIATLSLTPTFLPTHRNWLRPQETHSGWRPLAGTCTASSLCMRCLCHPRVTGTRPVMPRDPQPPHPHLLLALCLCISGKAKRLGLVRPGQRPPEGREGVPRELIPNGVFWHRQQGLLQVLKAYTLYRPEQGYCQAQGPVAAVLLMHLPPEVSALDPSLQTRAPDPPTPVSCDSQPQGL